MLPSPAYLQGVLMTQTHAVSKDSPLCCTTLGQVLLHATHNISAFAMYILHIICWNGNRSDSGGPPSLTCLTNRRPHQAMQYIGVPCTFIPVCYLCKDIS